MGASQQLTAHRLFTDWLMTAGCGFGWRKWIQMKFQPPCHNVKPYFYFCQLPRPTSLAGNKMFLKKKKGKKLGINRCTPFAFHYQCNWIGYCAYKCLSALNCSGGRVRWRWRSVCVCVGGGYGVCSLWWLNWLAKLTKKSIRVEAERCAGVV